MSQTSVGFLKSPHLSIRDLETITLGLGCVGAVDGCGSISTIAHRRECHWLMTSSAALALGTCDCAPSLTEKTKETWRRFYREQICVETAVKIATELWTCPLHLCSQKPKFSTHQESTQCNQWFSPLCSWVGLHFLKNEGY